MAVDTPQRYRARSVSVARAAKAMGIVAVVVYCLAPMYWMVVSSLRRTADIFDNSFFPQPLSLENYVDVFNPANNFGRALLNSCVVAGSVTILTLVISVLSSYALTRFTFRGRGFILAFIITASMFPAIALVVPLLRLFTDVGWINTYQAMIVPSMSFSLPLAVFTLTSFFRQMPLDLEHAAMLDGCTRTRAFFSVVLPLAAPAVFTTAILVFIASWNEYIIALAMTNKPDVQTATVAVSFFTGATGRDTPFGTQMAAGVLLTVPLLIAVLLFQRRIVAGLTAGSIK
ncbi:MAG: carbohydrate ABC transporter permease [Microbacterium sp.]|uniref:carbohydrate ABC transporter permease n=1 Tax=Microbacterium sp. TaxID=51671 RepID=UPI0039E25448